MQGVKVAAKFAYKVRLKIRAITAACGFARKPERFEAKIRKRQSVAMVASWKV
jgi:hypothetical protein